MKVRKGKSQLELVAAAFLVLYMALGEPFLCRVSNYDTLGDGTNLNLVSFAVGTDVTRCQAMKELHVFQVHERAWYWSLVAVGVSAREGCRPVIPVFTRL